MHCTICYTLQLYIVCIIYTVYCAYSTYKFYLFTICLILCVSIYVYIIYVVNYVLYFATYHGMVQHTIYAYKSLYKICLTYMHRAREKYLSLALCYIHTIPRTYLYTHTNAYAYTHQCV